MAAWSLIAVMCCNRPLSKEVANWCCLCWAFPGPAKWSASIKSQLFGIHLALQGCSVNFPHPRAAFLRHVLSFNDIPRSRGFLEQNPAHIGNVGLWLGQKVSHLGHSFLPDACWNGWALEWESEDLGLYLTFFGDILCALTTSQGFFWFQWTET